MSLRRELFGPECFGVPCNPVSTTAAKDRPVVRLRSTEARIWLAVAVTAQKELRLKTPPWEPEVSLEPNSDGNQQ